MNLLGLERVDCSRTLHSGNEFTQAAIELDEICIPDFTDGFLRVSFATIDRGVVIVVTVVISCKLRATDGIR